MAEITAATVKELRERTGAGMMDCKKALGETGGDMEAAVDWLRTKGLAAAAKKAGRTAAEGLVGVAVDGTKRRRRSRSTARPTSSPRTSSSRSSSATSPRSRCEQGGDVDAVLPRRLSGRRHRPGEADRQHRHDRREPVDPPRRRPSQVGEGVVVPYVHNAAAPGLGKIGVLVALESERRQGRARDARQAARHAHRRGQPAGAARRGSRRRPDRARARDRHGEGRTRPASPPRSSPRWSRAASPSSARRMRCCRQLFVMDNKTKVEDVVAAEAQGARQRRSRSRPMSASSSAKASRRRKATSPPRSPPLPASPEAAEPVALTARALPSAGP